jgi:hypothetical protein
VGHTARALEEAGIPTVVIMAGALGFRARTMSLPRTVISRHIIGRPLGAPGDVERQGSVLRTALDLLQSARRNGTIVELPEPYRNAP